MFIGVGRLGVRSVGAGLVPPGPTGDGLVWGAANYFIWDTGNYLIWGP